MKELLSTYLSAALASGVRAGGGGGGRRDLNRVDMSCPGPSKVIHFFFLSVFTRGVCLCAYVC